MSAREQLLDVSLRLMADRGIDAVPLQLIVDEAGQRNASAVHYHFGSRAGLVDAVARRHQGRVDELRSKLLKAAVRREPVTLTDLSACLVVPIAAMMSTREGRDGVRIVNQVILKYGFASVLSAVGEGRESLQGAWAALEDLLDDLPVAVRRQRIASCAAFQIAGWADRAIQIDAGNAPLLTHRQCVADAIATTAAFLGAPVVDMRTLRWATSAT